MCGSRKYLYPHHGRLFDLHPPTPQDFPFQGVFDDPPSPQEFPEFLKGDFAYHPLEILSGLGTLLKVNTNSVSYANTVESYYNSAV